MVSERVVLSNNKIQSNGNEVYLRLLSRRIGIKYLKQMMFPTHIKIQLLVP